MCIRDSIYTVPDLRIISLLASTLKYPRQSLAEKPGFGWINISGVPLIRQKIRMLFGSSINRCGIWKPGVLTVL